MDKVVDLFGDKTPQEEEYPNFAYTITLKDGTEVNGVGYLLLNNTFVGIAKGEQGILQFAYPTSDFASVINHGPVPLTTN